MTLTANSPTTVEDAFARDYLDQFNRLYTVNAQGGVDVTKANMAMFHQGAVRFAARLAAGRGDEVRDVDMITARCYGLACSEYGHRHTARGEEGVHQD